MESIDAKIEQCEKDIKKLQESLGELKKTKKKDEFPKWCIATSLYEDQPRIVLNLRTIPTETKGRLIKEFNRPGTDFVTIVPSTGGVGSDYCLSELQLVYRNIKDIMEVFK